MTSRAVLLLAGCILSFAAPIDSRAQNDPTSTIFPFTKGDIWLYELCESIFCEDEIRYEAIDDSVDTQGTRWVVSERTRSSSGGTGRVVFSVDTTGNVYASEWLPTEGVEGPALIFNAAASLNESWIAAFTKYDTLSATKVDSVSRVVFGDTTNVTTVFYEFQFTLAGKASDWAEGRGIIREIGQEPGLESRLKGAFIDGTLHGDTTRVFTSNEELPDVPKVVSLLQNFPNPFNPSTTITFDLRSPSAVSLVIYDITGRRVTALVAQRVMSAGTHQILWNAGQASSGVYFYRLRAGEDILIKSMMLIK